MADSTISDKDLDRYQLVIAFENYRDETLDPFVLSSLVDSYSPRVRALFNLALRLPQDFTSIRNYERCVTTPPTKPYYNKPTYNSMFPRRLPNHDIPQPKYSSLLPLLITAHRNRVDIRQYDVVSERNSLRTIAMNNENYVVAVKKYGSTIFLRRYDHRKVDMSDEGHRFERMCTRGYHHNASYHQLIEGHIGTLTTLITAETDAVSTENEKAIELKCRLIQNNIRDPLNCWLQTFLGGIDTVVVGQRSNGEPPQLIGIHEYDVSTIIDDLAKSTALEYLYRVLRFLLVNVEKDGTYVLSRRYDQRIRKYGVYLYKVANKDEERLTFISSRMLSQLAVNNQSGMGRESESKHLQSAGAKSQINQFLGKLSVNRDTLTNHLSPQSDMQVQEGEVKYRPGPSTSFPQMSSNTHTIPAITRRHRIENVTTDNGNEMDIAESYHASEYSYDDDDDDAKSSWKEDIDDICEAKEIEESHLSQLDRSNKKKEKSALLRQKKH